MLITPAFKVSKKISTTFIENAIYIILSLFDARKGKEKPKTGNDLETLPSQSPRGELCGS
jgi:hypothetical protein